MGGIVDCPEETAGPGPGLVRRPAGIRKNWQKKDFQDLGLIIGRSNESRRAENQDEED